MAEQIQHDASDVAALLRQIEESGHVIEENDQLAGVLIRLLRVWLHEVPDERTVFLTRSVMAATELAQMVPPRILADAASSRTSVGVLLSALRSREAISLLRDEQDPLVAARLRGLLARRSLLTSEGGTLSAAQVGEILGIQRQAVDKRRQKNQLIGVSVGGRNYEYPAWQLTEDGVLPGLQDVLHELRDHDPWTKIGFFLNGNLRLNGESPLASLRRGETEPVIRAARAVGEHGAA